LRTVPRGEASPVTRWPLRGLHYEVSDTWRRHPEKVRAQAPAPVRFAFTRQLGGVHYEVSDTSRGGHLERRYLEVPPSPFRSAVTRPDHSEVARRPDRCKPSSSPPAMTFRLLLCLTLAASTALGASPRSDVEALRWAAGEWQGDGPTGRVEAF